MTDKKPILLQHGWGFDSNMWNSWVRSAPELNFILPDRGYFEREHTVDYRQTETAVTHSFGLHLLPEDLFPNLKLLVIISGFQEFHPNTPVERTFSQRIVRHMLRNIKSDADTVLQKFCRNSYHPSKPDCDVSTLTNPQRLYEDLIRLDRQKLDLEMLRLAGRIVIIHGMKDGIVPHNKAYQLQYSLPESELIVNDEGGHMIPVTDTEWCLNQIKR